MPRKNLLDESVLVEHEILVHRPSGRIDRFLSARLPEYSRSLIQRWIHEGRVRIDARRCRPATRLHAGERILLRVPLVVRPEHIPTEMPLEILYEDPDMIAINKPPGVVVHPTGGHYRDTILNGLLAHVQISPGRRDVFRPAIVHRLDKGTSGVLLVAKTQTAVASLARQFRQRTIEKEYEAIVAGRIEQDEGDISVPIARNRRKPWMMGAAPRGTGQPSESHFRVLHRFPQATHVAVQPKTGRTHQIRVHLATIDHPCLGDPIYAPSEAAWGIARQALHARRIRFQHPATEAPMEISAPLPDDMRRLLDLLSSSQARRGEPTRGTRPEDTKETVSGN